MALKQIPAKEANAQQLFEYLTISGIPVADSLKRNEDEMRDLIAEAKLPDPIFISDVISQPVPGMSSEDAFSQPWDEENERWCLLRIQLDNQGEDTESAIPVIVNQDVVWLPRGVMVCVRERFWRHLAACCEIRYNQALRKDGTTGKFSEAVKTVVERYPHQFMGFKGLVKDGSPKEEDLPKGTQVRR